MSRLNLQWMMCGLVFLLVLAPFGVNGQAASPVQADPKEPAAKGQPGKDDDGAKNKRLLYLVKHGMAKDLAAVLGEHFKGVAEFQVLPESTSNALLISTAPAAFDEVVKVLDQLDRQPQTVSMEILIAEVVPKKGEGDKPAQAEEVEAKDFTGALADVVAKVEALQKKGVLTGLKRLQIAAVEGLPASVLIGENSPFVVGLNTTARGTVLRNISYRNSGLKADATVRVSPDKVVNVDLKLEESHPHVPEDGIPIGTDENGNPVMATDFAVTNLTIKLAIASGKAVAAQGVKTVAKSGNTQMVVIVGARVVEAEAKADK